MLADSIEIVFDTVPQSAKRLNIAITTGIQYPANVARREVGLYSLVDDKGREFNVSTYGRSYTNGGNWHIVGEGVDSEE